MKTIIILAAIAFAHGAKLERTYLPPTHAGTSGGSGNFLETPFSGPKSTEAIFKSNFGQTAQAETGHAQAGSQHAQFGAENARFGGEYAQNGNGFGQAGKGFAQQQYNEVRPERAQAALERNAAILRNDNSNDGETYAYAYETENGIYAEESGVATNGVEAQGGYSYTGDDGQVYSVRYTADQNGFVPQGDHLPTPPPIPEEILKALEQNARDEAAGIYDDGSYNEAKYSGSQNQGYEYEQGKNQYEQNQYEQTQNQYEQTQNQYEQNQNGNSFATDDAVVTNSALTRSSSRTFNTPARSDLGSSHSGIPARNSPQNAYLPPFAQPAQNAFGRRQSFDSRNGYRY